VAVTGGKTLDQALPDQALKDMQGLDTRIITESGHTRVAEPKSNRPATTAGNHRNAEEAMDKYAARANRTAVGNPVSRRSALGTVLAPQAAAAGDLAIFAMEP
jgi:hypothetical protein